MIYKKMALAFVNIFDEAIVQNIQDLIPPDPEPLVDWETLYGSELIYQTKHYITHTVGVQKGGMCISTGSGRLGGTSGSGTGLDHQPTPNSKRGWLR